MVTLTSIDKRFDGIPVLRGIDLAIARGEVLGLVGENGAGKSTLMNILGGVVRPDGGSMQVDGRPYSPGAPSAAPAAGIAFVHQELSLFRNLTIAENLFVARFPRWRGRPWIDRRAATRAAAALLARVGLPQHPETPVERLTAGERQLVEIARALGADARVLILDEPTTSLGSAERDRLHALIRELRRDGLAIIYISHELGDVLRLCDRVAVLRDGQVVTIARASDLSVDGLIRAMVGRAVEDLYPPRRARDQALEPLLELRDVRAPGARTGITFTLHRGELVGLFGLMGAGRSELARIVFGLDRQGGGEILLDGVALVGGPPERIANGLAYVTEDRRADGLCLDLSIADNLALVSLRALSRTPLGVIDRAAVHTAVARVAADVGLTASTDPASPARYLSGGNQQKLVLGKWLLAGPSALILDEPTRGIDSGARAGIYRTLHGLAETGTGLLLISSELEELTGLCDRIMVMRQGEIVEIFQANEFDRERLLRAALPTRATERARPESGAQLPRDRERGSGRTGTALTTIRTRLLRGLDLVPAMVLGLVVLAVGLRADGFLTIANASQILAQAAPTVVVAVGMTFVLITGGVDLSVGALMFIGAGLAGHLAVGGQPLIVCAALMIAVGIVGGGINAILITRFRLIAFVATLATLYIGRGAGRWITETRAINLPESFLALGASAWLGVPAVVWSAAIVALAGQLVLSRTPFGRQLYALGADPEAARKVGLPTRSLTAAAYVTSGACAGIGGLLALSRLGAVSPRFGELYEFDAITACVLGGTSLYGGRGRVLPGAVLGAVLLKTIFSGLVSLQADPYLYPLITAGIIFVAVLVDSLRPRVRGT